ncbi:ACT domain-containing protein [Alteromonas pelagimontana]|uniref:ACT domain-containing protein n=1 Tax=Alteromonas pelagimontana TaxID=1858656 RepID=A0A6M4MAR5_9ALTE|nr:ACT domain-containing protein [Alteromonas pelagimontana]QJR79665.1 ACT domain-containing protein [Alteromonas pelagimontana]
MPLQTLAVLPQQFSIHSVEIEKGIPTMVLESEIYFIGRTKEELSIVVPSDIAIESLESDTHWRALELIGPLELSMVGIMARIGAILAKAKVSIFVVSTFETDFFLIKNNKLKDAIVALEKADYSVVQE